MSYVIGKDRLWPSFAFNLHTIKLNRKARVEYKQRRIQDFLEGARANSKGGGHQPIIWPNVPENCMKMKKIGLGGLSLKFYYVDPPLAREEICGLGTFFLKRGYLRSHLSTEVAWKYSSLMQATHASFALHVSWQFAPHSENRMLWEINLKG